MDMNEFLKGEPLLNKAELSRRMWPDSKAPSILMAMRNRGQTATLPDDEAAAKRVLNELVERIKKYTDETDNDTNRQS